MNEMTFHPIADLFPLMQGSEFDDLVTDIKRHGLREPVWLYEQQILDGRNRWRACKEAGIEPEYRAYEGNDPVGFVVSLNLQRRHLNESQRAMVGAKIANIPHGGNRKPDQDANLRLENNNGQAAEKLNISIRSINSARRVRNHGTTALIEKVEAGQVKVSTAADIATLPEDDQTEIVARGEKAILQAAKDIRSRKARTRQQENERLKQQALAVPPPEGLYRCIVVDPPWPMRKMERDSFPNQSAELDYPTMHLEDIRRMDIPAADQCHLYLWTTQKFLWYAGLLMSYWGFDYLCTMVWHKTGGFQVPGLPQFNCEFVLLGRKGGLGFNETKQFFTCFNGPRREHSRKPDCFYDLVKRVSPGPRLDMFSREARQGYEQFGVEPDVFISG